MTENVYTLQRILNIFNKNNLIKMQKMLEIE